MTAPPEPAKGAGPPTASRRLSLARRPSGAHPSLRSRLRLFSQLMGLDPRKPLSTLRALPRFIGDWRRFRRASRASSSPFPVSALVPRLGDNAGSAGALMGHYFYQDLYVAQRIFALNPSRHVDVGSRIDGFVAHVAAYRQIEVLDVRVLPVAIHNVSFRQCDLTAPLPDELRGQFDSVSCLHALEHFGLGRYGDPVDPDGHIKGLANLAALLKTGGRLFVSFPIGPHRVEFNAHRVFGLPEALAMFRRSFDLCAFSFVDDDGQFHAEASLTEETISQNCGCLYGCGIFELTKKL